MLLWLSIRWRTFSSCAVWKIYTNVTLTMARYWHLNRHAGTQIEWGNSRLIFFFSPFTFFNPLLTLTKKMSVCVCKYMHASNVLQQQMTQITNLRTNHINMWIPMFVIRLFSKKKSVYSNTRVLLQWLNTRYIQQPYSSNWQHKMSPSPPTFS